MYRILTRVPVCSVRETVAKARQCIQSTNTWESVEYVYLVDRHQCLKGAVAITDIFRSAPRTSLRSLMTASVPTATERTTLERMVLRALHHHVTSIPIIDEGGKLVGVVGSKDILETLAKARIDDEVLYSGIHVERRNLLNASHHSILFLTIKRLPWLLVGLFGALLASWFVGQFEVLLQQVIELAFFTPAVVYMGAAVGNQTQALFLRSITLSEVRVSRFFMKEILVNACIGAVIAGISYVAIFLFLSDVAVASIVGVAMFLTTLVAGSVATSMTILLAKRKDDPALGAGPFATIIQDVVSLGIYFAVAAVMLFIVAK